MDNPYIWQRSDWPLFKWDEAKFAASLQRIEVQQAEVYGRLASFSADLINLVNAENTAQEVVSSSAIEGVAIDLGRARSSLMKRLGLALPNDESWRVSQETQGIISLVADTAENPGELTHARLKAWHSELFPSGRSGLKLLLTGEYRASAEPMQVVSPTRYGFKVHYEAPPADRLEDELERFLHWFNIESLTLPSPVRGAVAHLWFETLHPFEDGNGRIGRAIWDLALVQGAPKHDTRISRIACLSPHLAKVRDAYCDELEMAQKGDLDITRWITFSIERMEESLKTAMIVTERVGLISRFWSRIRDEALDERQRKVLNAVLSNPAEEDWISTRRFVKIAGGITEMTAFRAITDMVAKNILEKDESSSGRSTRYRVKLLEPSTPRLSKSIDWSAPM